MNRTSEDLGVALAKELCPICAKEIDGPILMGTVLSKKNAQKVNKMNGKIIGWSSKPCTECQEYINNGVFFVIGIDIEKSYKEGLYRSGHIIGLKSDCDFVKDLTEEQRKHNAIYMDFREMIRCGMIDIEEHGD